MSRNATKMDSSWMNWKSCCPNNDFSVMSSLFSQASYNFGSSWMVAPCLIIYFLSKFFKKKISNIFMSNLWFKLCGWDFAKEEFGTILEILLLTKWHRWSSLEWFLSKFYCHSNNCNELIERFLLMNDDQLKKFPFYLSQLFSTRLSKCSIQ